MSPLNSKKQVMLLIMVTQGSESNLFSIFCIILFLPNWLIKDTHVSHSDLSTVTADRDSAEFVGLQTPQTTRKFSCKTGEKCKNVLEITFQVADGFNVTAQSSL